MMLFSPDSYRKTYSDDSLVTLCSYCHDVAWPVGAHQPDREWITPESYYVRGATAEAVVTHGICPDCYRDIVEPNI
jgi:hypothetical protein